MNTTITTTQSPQVDADMYVHVIIGADERTKRLYRKLLQAGLDTCRPYEARVYVARDDKTIYWGTDKPAAFEAADQIIQKWAVRNKLAIVETAINPDDDRLMRAQKALAPRSPEKPGNATRMAIWPRHCV